MGLPAFYIGFGYRGAFYPSFSKVKCVLEPGCCTGFVFVLATESAPVPRAFFGCLPALGSGIGRSGAGKFRFTGRCTGGPGGADSGTATRAASRLKQHTQQPAKLCIFGISDQSRGPDQVIHQREHQPHHAGSHQAAHPAESYAVQPHNREDT